MHAPIKITSLLLLVIGLLTSCKQTPTQEPPVLASSPHQIVPAADLRAHLVGSWWCDNYFPEGPWLHVTFSPDGRWSSVNTNNPIAQTNFAFWRVEEKGSVIITKSRDALPGADGLAFNDEIFIVDHMSDTEIVFGQPSIGGRITFKK